jgi:hypothetical protein
MVLVRPTIKVYIATTAQAKSAKRWWSRNSFPGRNASCCAVWVFGWGKNYKQTVISELTRLGYDAVWNETLCAVIVTSPQGSLEHVGKRIQRELGSSEQPCALVDRLSRESF